MRRIICLLLALLMIFSLAGCGEQAEIETTPTTEQPADDMYVDLTQLSSTMVYSEVFNMMTNPTDYVGKTVKMHGQFSIFKAYDENNQPLSDQIYYACVIADATACCQQGIEFVLKGDFKYPDDYPEIGTEITVVGEFKTYMEGTQQYCHLINAELTDELNHINKIV